MTARPRLLLAAESLGTEGSGIGRVARLMARVLAEEQRRGRLTASALALNGLGELGIATRSAGGSRLRFVTSVAAATARADAALYDFAGMARAHPRLRPLWCPLLMWIHGIEVWEDARRDRLRAARAADVLVCNTAYTRDRAERLHGGFARARVCWLATESDEPPAAPGHREQTVTILGRIDEGGGYKGHRELVEAWPAVCRAVPSAQLLIAGAGPGLPAVERLVRRSPARDRIELLGFVAEADIERLWARTSVLAMPSRGEGFGLTYIEAMRHSVPVVASVHDAAVEVNVDGETGFNVNLDRAGQLEERLCETLTQPKLAQTLGAAGHERWRQHFTFSAFKRRFVPLLDELLSR